MKSGMHSSVSERSPENLSFH